MLFSLLTERGSFSILPVKASVQVIAISSHYLSLAVIVLGFISNYS